MVLKSNSVTSKWTWCDCGCGQHLPPGTPVITEIKGSKLGLHKSTYAKACQYVNPAIIVGNSEYVTAGKL